MDGHHVHPVMSMPPKHGKFLLPLRRGLLREHRVPLRTHLTNHNNRGRKTPPHLTSDFFTMLDSLPLRTPRHPHQLLPISAHHRLHGGPGRMNRHGNAILPPQLHYGGRKGAPQPLKRLRFRFLPYLPLLPRPLHHALGHHHSRAPRPRRVPPLRTSLLRLHLPRALPVRLSTLLDRLTLLS